MNLRSWWRDHVEAWSARGESVSLEQVLKPRAIQPVRAFEDDVVEIQWRLRDGSTFYHRVMIPPRSVRQGRLRRELAPRKDSA